MNYIFNTTSTLHQKWLKLMSKLSKREVNEDPEGWFCDVCDRVFKTQKKLREHRKTHTPEDR